MEGQTDPPIKEREEFKMNEKFERANRVGMEVSEKGYVAHFYRTHKHIGDIEVETVDHAHSNEARELARKFAIDQCPQYNIEWNPDYQEQAWERKYMKYATDEQVGEDAITLMNLALTGVADKLGYEWSTEFASIYAKKTDLSYVEDGKYTKDGCWAWADIVVDVTLTKEDFSIELPMEMELVSGQIKKCKLTQTILKNKIQVEEELQVA